MMRRAFVLAVVVVVTLAGCAPSYMNPDDRSHARGAEVDELIQKIEPQPRDVRVMGRYNAIRMVASLDEMTYPDSRDFVEQALDIMLASRLGTLPVSIELSHASARQQSRPLAWEGYDPARAERYFAAMELWMSVLADSATEFEDEFTVRSWQVSGSVRVYDDRDLDAYRAELVGALEAAGYVDPAIVVERAE